MILHGPQRGVGLLKVWGGGSSNLIAADIPTPASETLRFTLMTSHSLSLFEACLRAAILMCGLMLATNCNLSLDSSNSGEVGLSPTLLFHVAPLWRSLRSPSCTVPACHSCSSQDAQVQRGRHCPTAVASASESMLGTVNWTCAPVAPHQHQSRR